MVSVTSPMVGTFYRRPAPDQPAFVEVGQHVEAGETLCLIEAMKLFNEIVADVSGVVRTIRPRGRRRRPSSGSSSSCWSREARRAVKLPVANRGEIAVQHHPVRAGARHPHGRGLLDR